MNRLAIGFAMSAVVAVALGATSLYLLDRLHDQQLRAETELASRRNAEARHRELEERFNQLAREREESLGISEAALPGSTTSPAVAANTPETGEPDEARQPERTMRSRQNLLDTPKGRSVLRLQLKAASKERYAPLAKKMSLSAEQAEALYELLTDQRQKEREVLMRMDSPDRAAREAARETLQLQAQAEVAQLLGSQRAQQLGEYQATLPERARVDGYATRLDAANLPMREAQKEAFITAIAEEKAAVPEPRITDYRDPAQRAARLQWREDLMNRSLDRAASILSPDQIEVLRDFEELQLALERQSAERMTRRRGVAGDERRNR